MATREKFIIDVDTGVDDAHALMLVLSRPDIDVVGITCVAGNCHLDQVCINTLKVLQVCNKTSIPVYKGASKALLGSSMLATHYHGNDGLGDTDLDIPVNLDLIQKKSASAAIVDLVNQFPGEITILALAPLTNIALAIRQDPGLGSKLKKFFLMGGNIEGKGNTLVCVEFNFGCDPDAAYVVLNEIRTRIIVSPWEINLNYATVQPWDWFEQWQQTDTEKGRFVKAISKGVVERQKMRNMPGFRSCDLAAAAMATSPSLILETRDVYATVELKGEYTRGMMVVDWNGILCHSPNMTIILQMDVEEARKLYSQMLL